MHAIQQPSDVASKTSGRVPVPLPQSTLQYPTAAVVGPPRAHCSGTRCRMRWLAQEAVAKAEAEAEAEATETANVPTLPVPDPEL